MGLDQYLYLENDKHKIMVTDPNWKPSNEVSATLCLGGKATFHKNDKPQTTWRKYHELQDYMETLWRRRIGKGMFNQCPFTLSATDLDELEAWFRSKDADYDSDEDPSEQNSQNNALYYRQANKMILRIARPFQQRGYKVIYDSWW